MLAAAHLASLRWWSPHSFLPRPCTGARAAGGSGMPRVGTRLKVITFGVKSCSVDEWSVDAAVDVRPFQDPGAGSLRDHDGRHPEIIFRLMQHSLFPAFLCELKQEIDAALQIARRGDRD